MRCTLCRAAEAEHPKTTCVGCSADLPGRVEVLRAVGSDDEARRQRRAALSVRCPFCKAGPGSDCKKPGRRGLVRTQPHPSRLEVAAGSRAA